MCVAISCFISEGRFRYGGGHLLYYEGNPSSLEMLVVISYFIRETDFDMLVAISDCIRGTDVGTLVAISDFIRGRF